MRLLLILLGVVLVVGVTVTVKTENRSAQILEQERAERQAAKERAERRVQEMWQGIPDGE